jgi:hypothetical protein
VEQAQTEEIEVGAAVHLPLEQLQLVDLALGLTIAPLSGEPGFDGRAIVGSWSQSRSRYDRSSSGNRSLRQTSRHAT